MVAPFTPAWLVLQFWEDLFFSSQVALDVEY